jgi:TorA maturation chaperone TorD
VGTFHLAGFGSPAGAGERMREGQVTGKANAAVPLELIETRYANYALLARLYREEPSLDLLRFLASAEQSEAAAGSAETPDPFLSSLAVLAGPDLERLQAELAAEYAALFLNASARAVHAFESVYTSPERLVMQRARDEVLREYREAGVERARDFREPEDHLALECEFMAHLCRKSLQALQGGDRASAVALLKTQLGFLRHHLVTWVPRFCDDLRRATDSAFYQWAAGLTADLVRSEQDAIPQLIAMCE